MNNCRRREAEEARKAKAEFERQEALRKQEEARQAELRRQEKERQAREESQRRAEFRRQEEARQAELKRQEEAKRAKAEEEALQQQIVLAQQKGPDYAKSSGTKWTVERKVSEMIDKEIVTVTSVQTNDYGAVGTIVGQCEGPHSFVFSVVLERQQTNFGLQPKEVIELPLPDTVINQQTGELIGLGVSRRINDSEPARAVLRKQGFSNKFLIAQLNISDQASGPPLELGLLFLLTSRYDFPVQTTWRILVEIQTGYGDLLLKIPIYDKAITELANSCSQ